MMIRVLAALFLTGVLTVKSVALEISDLNPLHMPEAGSYQLRVLSPTVLELTLITSKLPDPDPVEVWDFVGDDAQPKLPDPSEFQATANGQPIAISQVGFKRRPLYAPLSRRDLRIANDLYLMLGEPIADGANVEVRNPGRTLWTPEDVSYRAVADPLRFNPAIHVNQAGYMPEASKKAMVGYYLGSLGEMTISSELFRVTDNTGKEVYSGSLTRRPDIGYVYSPLPYQKVYEADFSSFAVPGEYRLKIEGMGASHSFVIHHGVAAAFARAYALGFYHQRCGAANELPFTRHVHAPCHTSPAEIPTMEFKRVNELLEGLTSDYANNPRHTAPRLRDVDSSLYPFVQEGKIDVTGGHHDAGDYSKYTINSAALIHHLIFAADVFPGAAALDNLGLPESGDGQSDLLQLARWEADFLSKMQDADGGFYFLVYPRDRQYEHDVLPDRGDPQVVFPKTTAATAAAVAALAEAGSSPAFRKAFPAEAEAYMQCATKGWAFLMDALDRFGKDGAYQKITHYGNEFMHDDELAWAAAAMFAATGDESIHELLRNWYDPTDPITYRWGWWRLFEGFGCAARTYAFAGRTARRSSAELDAAYLLKCETEIIAAGSDSARFARQTAYGSSFPDITKRHRTAGWFFSSERAFDIAVALQLTGDESSWPEIISNFNYEGGCNPVNMSYITGLGWKRQYELAHQYAQNDRRVLPPSGLPIGNIQAGFMYLDLYGTELGRLCFPPDWSAEAPYPFYDRWGDSYNTTTEFVVPDLSRSLATAALWMARSAFAGEPSRVKTGQITGVPDVLPPGLPAVATMEIPGEDLKDALIVWEARDHQPAFGHAFTFAPKTQGDQWIEAEAVLPDGQRFFAMASFTSPNEFQSSPLPLTDDIAALFHLDESLVSAGANGWTLQLLGNARLDTGNVSWMSEPSGAALRFFDLGDKAVLSFPSSELFTAGDTVEITLEAMVYVNAYRGYNRGHARLLSLVKGWNASLEWREDMYAGPMISGGTHLGLLGPAITSAMPSQQWHHLSISINRDGYFVQVNGQAIASVQSNELNNWGNGTASLELGNFDGWIDEIAIRTRGPNLPPDIALVAPADGAQYASPAAIGIEAAASDPDGEVVRVEFFVNSVKLSETSSSPFVAFWENVPNGTYVLTAKALDNMGVSSSSAPVEITVLDIPPAVIPADPSHLSAQGISATEISLQWRDNADNETSYLLERSSNGKTFELIATLPANSTDYTDTGLTRNTRYYYRVAALNDAGRSGYSNTANGRTKPK
jgi:hypothetical protein